MAVAYTTVQTEQTILERVTDKLDEQLARLDAIDKKIREEFEKLLFAIEARRDKLLQQVGDLRKEFEAKNTSIVENLRGLENLREHIKVMPEKQDCVVMKKQQEYFDGILDSEIEKVASDNKLKANVKFNCYTDQLMEHIKSLGEIVDESSSGKSVTRDESDYSKKLKAAKVVTRYKQFFPRYENNKFARINKLHINKHLLYVLCNDSSEIGFPIAVFNAKKISFSRKFGEKGYFVSCMTVGDEFIYVGYTSHVKHRRQRATHKLILYKLSDYSFVKEAKVFEDICPVDMGFTDNQVFVLCSFRDSVKSLIYDRSLNEVGEVNISSDQFPKSLKDTRTKFIGNKLYVLFEKKLRVFSISNGNSYLFENGKNTTDTFVCLFIVVCLFV